MIDTKKQESLEAGKAFRPRDIADVVGKYIKAGNMDGVLSMFHKNCTVYFPPNPLTNGLAEIGELFAPFIASKATLISEVTNELINGDTALLQANWRVEDETGTVMAEGASTEVAKQKDDGTWIYYLDCPYGPPEI